MRDGTTRFYAYVSESFQRRDRKHAVSKWEHGEKRPDGPSLKLLNLVKVKGLRAIT